MLIILIPEPSRSRRGTNNRKGFFSRIRARSADSRGKMAASESVLRELTHPALNEHLKNHNAVTFKLVKTG